MAVADGLVALYLAAHTVLRRPRNAPQVAVVVVALVVVGIALGWLALRSQPPPGPARLEQPAVTGGLTTITTVSQLKVTRDVVERLLSRPG